MAGDLFTPYEQFAGDCYGISDDFISTLIPSGIRPPSQLGVDAGRPGGRNALYAIQPGMNIGATLRTVHCYNAAAWRLNVARRTDPWAATSRLPRVFQLIAAQGTQSSLPASRTLPRQSRAERIALQQSCALSAFH